MDAVGALQAIRGLASANRFVISGHAAQRGLQRGATANDIQYALMNASRCIWQDDHETWKVEGPDLDGDDLTLAVVIEDDVIVVTVF